MRLRKLVVDRGAQSDEAARLMKNTIVYLTVLSAGLFLGSCEKASDGGAAGLVPSPLCAPGNCGEPSPYRDIPD